MGKVVQVVLDRRGEGSADEEATTAEEAMAARIDRVWELTLQCMAWENEDVGEPRLRRSVVHVQRRRR